MIRKFASMPIISAQSGRTGETTTMHRTAVRADFSRHKKRAGYIYVASRAISSRTNDNYDTFPADEIEKSYKTFIGKPVFVNHHNEDHRRARGFCIDAVLHRDTNPDGSPDTWVEVLMEVDAQRFPKLAKAVLAGEIDRTSMGVDVERSKCSACDNVATSPSEYCVHVPAQKGNRIYKADHKTGKREGRLIHEECRGLHFFENSLLVEDPADPTAFVLSVDKGDEPHGSTRTANKHVALPGTSSGDSRGKRNDDRHSDRETSVCSMCGSDIYKVQDGSPNGSWQHDIDSGAGLPHMAVPKGQMKEATKTLEELLLEPPNRHQAFLSQMKTAFGETKAPVDVDTLRQSTCPICGNSDSAFDGGTCRECGFVQPPSFLQTPDLDLAKKMDLRKDIAVDPEDVDEDGEVPSQDGPIDPDELDEDGQPKNLGTNPDDDQQESQDPVDPTQLDEDGNPLDPSLIQNSPTQPGMNNPSVPGTPGDGAPDLVCPVCGYSCDARMPQTNVMSDKFAQQPDDGCVEGDLCPACHEGQMMSPLDQQAFQQEQQTEQQMSQPVPR